MAEERDLQGCLALPLVYLNWFLCGAVLHEMWRWFLEPALLLPSPGYICCLGLILVVNLFRMSEKTSDEEVVYRQVMTTFGLLFLLLHGWFLHLFM